MCAVMSYKTTLSIECLLTHITDIRALTAMYMLMFYKIALMSERFITHKYKGIHHYVRVDVL